MITMKELTMGRDLTHPADFTKEVQQNLQVLHQKINIVRQKYNRAMIVTSGWRPPSINAATPGAAKKSKHMVGLAVDIKDADGSLFKWTMENLELMQELGLYIESGKWTKGWVHYQLGQPASGKRVFRPSSAPPTNPTANDTYDKKFDKSDITEE